MIGLLTSGMLTLAGFTGARAGEPVCPVAPPFRVDIPATRAALFHRRPITIVALGSSSTEGAGASAIDKTYPARLAAELRETWPDVEVKVLNRGIGGQTVDAVLVRLDADVLAEHPTLVIWQAGTNEILRAMDPAWFGEQLDEGVRRIVASGADLVLLDTQIAPRVAPDQQAIYDGVMAQEARERHVPLFSRARLMREWQADGIAENAMIGPDGLHHTDLGYACLAAALGETITVAAAKGIPVAQTGR